MEKFGMYVKFTAQPGKREELLDILLQAVKSMEEVSDCEVYIVNTSDTDQDTVWVTEVWTSEAAHQSSLTLESARAMIQHAKPLIAGIEGTKLTPLGGKGIL